MKLFKKKKHPRVEEFEKGLILHVDDQVDNKELFTQIKEKGAENEA